MRKLLLVAGAILLAHFVEAQYKVDSMCGARVNLDKNGKLLGRYQPQTPGASYVIDVKLAVDFLKKCPLSPKKRVAFISYALLCVPRW